MIKKNKILIFFFIWSLWISAEFLLGPFSHVRIHDNGDGALPQLIAVKIQFQDYGYNYFASYMASGVDASSQFFLPFSNLNSTLFILFPGWAAYGILMFVQRFLASYFTFRLCRDSLKLNFWASVVAGLMFSLFNFSIFSFTVYHQLSLPALPFILWILERINKIQSFKKYLYSTLFGLFIGYSNYFVYFTPYLLPFIFIWFIYIKGITKKDVFANLIFFAFSTIFIQLPSIIAVFSNIYSSHRIFWNFPRYQEYLSSIYRLISTLFWSNLIPISLIIFVIIIGKKVKDKTERRLLTLSALIIFLVIISKIVQPILPQSFTILRTISSDRFDMIISFILPITSVFLLSSFLRTKSLQFKIITYSLIATILIAGSIKIKIETLANYAPYRSLYQHPDLIQLANQTDNHLWRVATITGGGARSSYPLAYGLSTVDTYLTLYPANYHQFWAKVIAKRIAEDKLRYEDFIIWGNRIYLYGPKDFYNLEKIELQKYYNLDLLSLVSVKYIISQKPVSDDNLILLPSSYRDQLKNWDKLLKLQKLKKFVTGVYFGPPLYIYENNRALPKFFTLDSSRFIVEDVTVKHYSPDKIILSTKSKDPLTLVTTINYYPWWKAKINGKEVEIEKYEDTFMSLNIPKGQNQIIFEYLPPYKI